MNTVAKGNRAEKEVEDYCRKQNMKVWRAKRTSFGGNDFLDFADVVAISPGLVTSWYFLSVKSNGHGVAEEKRTATSLKHDYGLSGMRFIVLDRKQAGQHNVRGSRSYGVVWKAWEGHTLIAEGSLEETIGSIMGW